MGPPLAPLGPIVPDKDKIASRLCDDILELLRLILKQESWVWKSEVTEKRPNQPISNGECNARHADPDAMEEDENTGADRSYPQHNLVDTEMTGDSLTITSPEGSALGEWNKARFDLNEERDRLCLWRFNFTDDELNKLASTPSTIFGCAMVESLVNIAQALVNEVGT
jgi:hypothetical protein